MTSAADSNVAQRRLRMALFAALLASIGDVSMLYVANARRPQLALPAPPTATLWIGAALGVVAIPLYAFGYRAAASMIAPANQRAARIVSWCGTVGSCVGALIHRYTGVVIDRALRYGEAPRDPLAAVAAAPALVALWIVAGGLVVVASLQFARAARRHPEVSVRRLAWLNPVVVTVLIALAGTATPSMQAFVVPAAPNLAHVVFFAALARASRAESERN